MSWVSAGRLNHCRSILLQKTVFSYMINLFIMLEQYCSFFSPPIAPIGRKNSAKQKFPSKWVTNHIYFPGSFTWNSSLLLRNMETLAPNEMIYDLNRMLNCLQNQNFGGCVCVFVCFKLGISCERDITFLANIHLKLNTILVLIFPHSETYFCM